jgi:hypothetical protein
MTPNWNNFKCRCSGIKKIMAESKDNPQLTEKQAKELADLEWREVLTAKQKERVAELIVKKDNGNRVVLSDTCIEYLMEVYAWETQGMIAVNKESMDLLQTKKGKMTEFEGIIMLSLVDGEVYKENKDRIENDYLSGEIDAYIGESVYEATRIADIKSAFDYPTFLKKINNGLENGQREQVAGYCDISGAKEGVIANVLVNNPDEIIEEMKYRVARKFNALTTESPDFLEEWVKWERSMRFDHIPKTQRVHKIQVELFSQFERQKIYDRVKICREYLAKFDEEYNKMNTA